MKVIFFHADRELCERHMQLIPREREVVQLEAGSIMVVETVRWMLTDPLRPAVYIELDSL